MIYPNTLEICLTPNHLLFGRQLLHSSNTTSTVVKNLTVLSSTVETFSPATLLKRRLQQNVFLWTHVFFCEHKYFSVNTGVFLWTQVFFCEYCQIFKNTYFEEYLQTAVSGKIKDIESQVSFLIAIATNLIMLKLWEQG